MSIVIDHAEQSEKRRTTPRAIAVALRARGLKRCARCQKTKPFDGFCKYAPATDGHSCYCRECRKAHKKESMARHSTGDDLTAERRFLGKIKKIPSGCWLWRGALTDEGFGLLTYKGKPMLARLVACRLFGVSVPTDREQISHMSCKVPTCANPEHVIFCTRRELSLTHARENPFGIRARKTHCVRGHELQDGVNVYWRLTPKAIIRECIDCRRWRFPGTALQPNRRSDAVAAKEAALLQLVDGALPKNLPAEVFHDARHDLLVRLKAREVRKSELTLAAKRAVTRAWEFMPDRFGSVSLDAERVGQDGTTSLMDYLADESEWSDPAMALELQEEAAGA